MALPSIPLWAPLSMFACKVCKSHEARIADLKDQILYLRAQLSPSPSTPLRVLEADAILSGNQTTIEIPDPEEDALKKAQAVIAQRDQMLSASF